LSLSDVIFAIVFFSKKTSYADPVTQD